MTVIARLGSQPRPHRLSTQLLNQKESQDFDVDLMQSPGFSIDQLMELAGEAWSFVIVCQTC